TKMASPFLLDSHENGGLALSLTEKGIAYGTVGLIALMAGGILGGIVASRNGLKKWIWWMAISINVPNVVYIFMSYVLPDNLIVVNACIAVEQFGYGFGFTGYMLYMLYIAGQGEYKTAHFAIATGFMALGMMIPGMISGAIQEFLGYQHFFIYVIICTIPSFVALWFIKIDPSFGVKKSKEQRA
ncbi:MAG: MFS transporter, partial [Bacteroidales bacterium]|nr:MFS transporter [Bacteroidales bacterium]